MPSQNCVSCREVQNLTVKAIEGAEPDWLADIISQVPSVIDFLPCVSKKAVLSCSRQCRSLMHNCVTAIMLNKLYDLGGISSSTWPSLDVVVIKQQMTDLVARDAIAWSKLQVLAVFGLDYLLDLDYMVLILKPSTHQQCLDVGIKRQLETLSRFMHAIRCWKGMLGEYRPCQLQFLETITLRQSQLGSASLTQLFSFTWRHLYKLDLSDSDLNAAAVDALAKGKWPRLRTICLNCSILNTIGIAQLTQRLEPQLTHLILRGAPSAFPDASLAAFVAALPRITHLTLQGVQLGFELSEALARTHSHLRGLHLRSAPLDAMKLSGLTLAAWRLTELSLRNSGLGADAMAVLALCRFPRLYGLCLSHNQLDQAAAQQVVTGRWPELQNLDVSCNALDNRAMEALGKGQWPQLYWLHLQGNFIDAVGVAELVKGLWPELRHLQLDHTAMSAETCALLALDPTLITHHEDHYEVPRLLKCASQKSLIWEDMSHVAFGEYQFDV